jgi:hypothetical protein
MSWEEQATEDRYRYFNRYRSYSDIMLNHHEIEKAIRFAIGERDFDKKIQRIWQRVLSSSD